MSYITSTLQQSHRRMEMETCGFYGPVSETAQGLHCRAARGKENMLPCACVVARRTLCAWIRTCLEGTYLTVWTEVQRPFWPICPGRRGLSGGGPASPGGYSMAPSSHSPLKCWRPAGVRPGGCGLQGAGPPPWALPLLSPSGTGLCCSLQQKIEQEREDILVKRLQRLNCQEII